MSTPELHLLLLAIGFVAGLRTVTAPAAVVWAARLGWLDLHGTPFAFLGSTIAVAFFTIGALGEFITDQLPATPARTVPVQFGARIVTGAFSGAALALAAGHSIFVGNRAGSNRRDRRHARGLSRAQGLGEGFEGSGHCRGHSGRHHRGRPGASDRNPLLNRGAQQRRYVAPALLPVLGTSKQPKSRSRNHRRPSC